jgi:Ceramidase
MILDKRLLLILGISALAIVVLLLVNPIKQDSSYHAFADSRVIAQIPNFFNVISNLPFIFVGFLGIRLTLSPEMNIAITPLKKAYLLFFIGLLLTGLGSGFYHYRPSNSSLLWDRLPMAISFIAFFCAVVGECISTKIALRLLLPLLALGIVSVFYWRFTELQGHGDLRPYILVQFLPIALMPLILWLYDGKQKNCNYVWVVLVAYFLAKIAESMDMAIYQHLFVISGHSLKHLLAGLGAYFVYAALRQRRENY